MLVEYDNIYDKKIRVIGRKSPSFYDYYTRKYDVYTIEKECFPTNDKSVVSHMESERILY